VKLVLFDVDGTLLTAHGAGKRALHRALLEVFGTAGPIDAYDFRGRTDTRIVRDLLDAAGVPAEVVQAREGAFFDRYVAGLEEELAAGGRVSLLPGVADLVEALTASGRCLVGLLTGNVEGGARAKLRPTGLLPHFRVGAFGSDDPDRRRLPAVAAGRAAALAGRTFRGPDTVIVGDTPRDIDCARAFDASAVAVATGGHSLEGLAAHAPDHLFADLTDTGRVVEALLG
jgi:phosphoglycolate phosphatase-like HAD superfamily hydrolase